MLFMVSSWILSLQAETLGAVLAEEDKEHHLGVPVEEREIRLKSQF